MDKHAGCPPSNILGSNICPLLRLEPFGLANFGHSDMRTRHGRCGPGSAVCAWAMRQGREVSVGQALLDSFGLPQPIETQAMGIGNEFGPLGKGSDLLARLGQPQDPWPSHQSSPALPKHHITVDKTKEHICIEPLGIGLVKVCSKIRQQLYPFVRGLGVGECPQRPPKENPTNKPQEPQENIPCTLY